MKFRNSCDTLRNIFILHKLVLCHYQYNKTDALTNRPKIISRFLPTQVSQLVIAYIADIQPFAHFLSVEFLGKDFRPSPFLFEDYGVPWLVP